MLTPFVATAFSAFASGLEPVAARESVRSSVYG
jgi:hypothetical protein